jgi:hypothetical protein
MSLGMMQDHIRKIRQDLEGAVTRRDVVLQSAGFKDYDSFVKAAVPRRPPRGIQAWLRNALRAFSSVGIRESAPEPLSASRFVSPVTADIIQMRQLEVDALERRAQSLEVEVQKKFSIPAACLVFVRGAPLGIRARKSGISVAFLSILFFIFYYLCLAGGEELADRRLLAPWVAMWTPNLVIGAIGILLTLQAAEIIRRPRRKPRRRRAVPA